MHYLWSEGFGNFACSSTSAQMNSSFLIGGGAHRKQRMALGGAQVELIHQSALKPCVISSFASQLTGALELF